MSFPVLLAPQGESQLNTVDSEWRANRHSAPDLFLEEFLDLAELLSLLPNCGQKHFEDSHVLVRRYILRATRYHVYYRHESDRVVIVSLWSAVRGTGPAIDDLLA